MNVSSPSLRDLVAGASTLNSVLQKDLDAFDKFRRSIAGKNLVMHSTVLPWLDSQRCDRALRKDQERGENNRGIGQHLAQAMSYEAKVLAQFIDTVIANEAKLKVGVVKPQLEPLGFHEQTKQSFLTSDGYNFEKLSTVADRGGKAVEVTNYSVMAHDEQGQLGEGLDLVVERDTGKATITNIKVHKRGALRISADSLDAIAQGEIQLPQSSTKQ